MSRLLKAPRAAGGAPVELYREGEVYLLEPPPLPEPEPEPDPEPEASESPPEAQEAEDPAAPPPPPPPELREQILAEAQEAARAIRDQALAEAVSLKQEAYENGLAQGRQEAAQQAAQEAARLYEELEGLRLDLEARLERTLAEVEPALVSLACEIAAAVIHYEVESGHPVAVETARACLERVRDAGAVKLQVNPQDLQSVLAAREELKAAAAGVSELQVIADRRVERGGCLLETSKGYWDARIRPQMGRVRAALTGADEHGRHGPR